MLSSPIPAASQRGFTIIELVVVMLVIGTLLALVFSTHNGIAQKERNTERQRDINEIRDEFEAYYSQNNKYPTLQEVNNSNWRSSNTRGVDKEVWRDPNGTSYALAPKAAKNTYSYNVTSSTGGTCDNQKSVCAQYSLTATLEAGSPYTKGNLN